MKDVSEFGRNKRMADGLARYCKGCFRRRSTQRYRKRMEQQGRTVRERIVAPEGHKYCPRVCLRQAGRGIRKQQVAEGWTRRLLQAVSQPGDAGKPHPESRQHADYHLKRRYGITEDDFARMLARQGGLCAICQVVPGTFVDHCHRTGAVRGVLCFNCNNGLGHFGDNTVLLELAALYLGGEVLWPEFVVLPGRARDAPVARTRNYHLARRYRVRHEDVERMISAQHGLCVVCWDRPPEHVDHCHESGEVRFALCLPCNTGIGQFRDDAGVVWRALSYVEAAAGEDDDDVVVSDEELAELIRAEEESRSEFYRSVTRVG
ncbi:endonuclease domain-containing protein [Nonomuraea candida]|uniref:endonuclease domain-containing protein n=1 Tax=Nonomuraea candida TaxID=359159 RepID=UPI000A04025B|nr:endonuclease domain-containing protein [Nonomuraea candida]